MIADALTFGAQAVIAWACITVILFALSVK